VGTSGGCRHLDVQVIPLEGHDNTDVHYLVLFEQPTSSPANSRAVGQLWKLTSKADVRQHQQELAALREYVRFVIEQQQDANVALQSSQSELDSVNQELQSINEELEMSQLETFSSKEELITAWPSLRTSSREGDAAWIQGLPEGLYSRWLRGAIQDGQLASEVARIENDPGLSLDQSRALIKAAMERWIARPPR